MALLGCFEPLLQRLVLVEPILQYRQRDLARAEFRRVARARCARSASRPEDTAGSMRLVCPAQAEAAARSGSTSSCSPGQYDQIAPPEEIEELARQWGGAHFACFPQGHVGYTLMPESFRMAQEIWAIRFRGRAVLHRAGLGPGRDIKVGLPLSCIDFFGLSRMIKACPSSPLRDWSPARSMKAVIRETAIAAAAANSADRRPSAWFSSRPITPTKAAELLELVRVYGHVPTLVGCSGTGLVGTAQEQEEGSGFSLMLVSLPGGHGHGLRVRPGHGRGGDRARVLAREDRARSRPT